MHPIDWFLFVIISAANRYHLLFGKIYRPLRNQKAWRCGGGDRACIEGQTVHCNDSKGFLRHSRDDVKMTVKTAFSVWWFEMTNPAGNLTIWPQLLWITLSSKWISTLMCNWIRIYLLGKVVCSWNNWGLTWEEKKYSWLPSYFSLIEWYVMKM